MLTKSKINLLIIISIFVTKTNAEPIYPAEIVGRDLSIIGLTWAGHIGITTAANISQTSDHIIEVMNDSPVIQINSLIDFKAKTAYWGSRYGISDRGEHGTQILNEANLQRGLCPIYTATAGFQPGMRYEDGSKPTRCAIFRCDTFVNHVFHTAGYDLSTYNGFTLPVTVFGIFPKGHADGPYARFASQMPITSQTSINLVKAKQLDQMSSEEFIATVDLPKQKTTPNTISKTWNLAKNLSLNEEKRIYLVDYLGLAGTVDLIPQFISEYAKTTNQALKSMLIRSTFTLEQKFSWLKDYPNEKELLQKFYSNLINQNLPERDSELVLRGFIDLSSKEMILSRINQLSSGIKHDKLFFNPQISISLWIELIMKSKELERNSVPEILSILSHENNPDLDDIFNQFIVRRLTKLGLNSLESESKYQISAYLDSVAFRYNPNTFLSTTSNLNAPYYGAWLEAKALVNSETLEEASDFITNFIKSKPDNIKANFSSGLSQASYLRKK
ncbi:MAG: hypothetical protein H0U70_04090 [Tatlockia sp.]|nr:hypothetical protein [Tatlockia sp.]